MENIMRRAAIAAILLLASVPVWGQRLGRGEKMPEYRVKEWIGAQPATGRATIVEFFHSGNKVSVARLEQLERLAKDNSGSLNVIVIAREDLPEVRQMLAGKSFHVALDDEGKTFEAFSALYVPYAVLADSKGRVVWLGNPESLKDEEIMQYIK